MYTKREQEKLILHIAVNGCDGWSGLLPQQSGSSGDGPLASIVGARDRIRVIRKAGKLKSPVEVLIHEGIYQIMETIKFSVEDLGDEQTPVTYRSAGDGQVTLTGGLVLKGFEKNRNGFLKLDLNAAGYTGDGINQLFHNGVRQVKARYPKLNIENPYGAGWLYAEGPIVSFNEDGHGQFDRFICKDPRLKTWSNLEDIELFIFPRYNWTNNIIRLKSYDPRTGEIVLQEPCLYEIYPGDRFYFRNVREELNAPMEWYFDKEINSLRFYPTTPLTEDTLITIPLVENIIEVTGEQRLQKNLYIEKIDWTDGGGKISDSDKIIRLNKGFINFAGLTIDCCDGAGILFENVKGCSLKGSTIRNTGGVGVVVLRGEDCCIEGCDIYDTGSHGIYVSGGIRSPFNGVCLNCGNEVVNNYIHHMGATYKSVAGVAINGVGIRVAHNYIHDGPRWGILSRGSDNILEYNHIRHVNIETSDTSAIYLVDRDLSMRGTKIKYNHIHDILGYHCVDGVWHSPAFAFGIYLDDWTSGVEIKGNLIYRTPAGGVFIHAGQDNVVVNNMFLETMGEMMLLRRWEKLKEYIHLGTHDLSLRHNTVKKNIFASRKESACLYRLDNTTNEETAVDIGGNIIDQNLLWQFGHPIKIQITGGENPLHTKELQFDEWRKMGFDQQSIVVDPMFVDISNEDFHLKGNSPAFNIGFEALPFEKMGLYESIYRVSWPIVEAVGAKEQPLTNSKSTI